MPGGGRRVFPAPGLAQEAPVCRSVAGSAEAGEFDEGLKQVDGVPILGLPQRIELARGQSEHVAGQMRHANPGQNEKTHIVGY